MFNRTLYILICCVIAVVLSGCMLGPDYSRPDTPVLQDTKYSNVPGSWSDSMDPNGIGRWWESFGDEATNELVELALKNNYDLKRAAARVVETEALYRVSFGALLPQVNYSANRARVQTVFQSPAGRASFVNKNYMQEVRISYVTDIFGRLKRDARAAMADLYASRESRQALAHSLVAQVVLARIRVATQQRLLKTATENVDSRRSTLSVVERRYNSGLTSSLDIHLAKENLDSAEAAVPLIRRELNIGQHSLDVLCGRLAGSKGILSGVLPDMDEPEPVPTAFPAALLDRRPDIRAAEMQLAASTERIGSSIAAMFPDLTLSLSGGYSSGSYRMLSATENQIFAFFMNAAAPIYRGGSLKAQVEASKARRDQQLANYAQVILKAFEEVENALVSQSELYEQGEFLKLRLKEAKISEELAKQRYSVGLETILVLLDTERRRRRAEDELSITMGQLYSARVQLFLALGGDWKLEEGSKVNESETGVKDG
ncbi:MAG: efflux transporter outer membrane subunit [Planctomycetes bacterium]|nr:efflux transporter outer membrane subunit [Planctomycetota bacterium]